jgi:hypothetical protein
MNSERIKEIQKQTPYPESISVMVALKQVWNECEQDLRKELYSEEEVINIIDSLFHNYASSFRIDAKEYFLEFKKK